MIYRQFASRARLIALALVLCCAPASQLSAAEPVNTLRLEEKGLLAPFRPSHAGDLPETLLQTKKTWDFENDEPGKIAKGFTNEVGQWEVANDGDNRVLYQKAKNEDATFNVVLVDGTNFKDVDLSVKLRAVAGLVDRGGGVVWRAKDKKNYYICRYNPLEDNFRVYKVVDGKRTMFKNARTPGDEKWHTLRVTMAGSKIACYLDGQKHLEAEDTTFSQAGRIGLWSKADAQSYFDQLTVSE